MSTIHMTPTLGNGLLDGASPGVDDFPVLLGHPQPSIARDGIEVVFMPMLRISLWLLAVEKIKSLLRCGPFMNEQHPKKCGGY